MGRREREDKAFGYEFPKLFFSSLVAEIHSLGVILSQNRRVFAFSPLGHGQREK